jgi:hypothetical protein
MYASGNVRTVFAVDLWYKLIGLDRLYMQTIPCCPLFSLQPEVPPHYEPGYIIRCVGKSLVEKSYANTIELPIGL